MQIFSQHREEEEDIHSYADGGCGYPTFWRTLIRGRTVFLSLFSLFVLPSILSVWEQTRVFRYEKIEKEMK